MSDKAKSSVEASSDVLLCQSDGTVATLTLNRPNQFNALNAELRAALRAAVVDIEADEAIRVVILKGSGRGFCSGADLTGGAEHPVNEHLDREYKPALTGIANSDKIWIAQVHGSAAGIGAAFAMNCDLMTMADDSNLYMAFAAIGLIPDGGNTQLLLQNMGYHRALEAVLEGRKIPARECHEYGIANKLFAATDLDTETLNWAKALADGAPLAMGAAKRLLRSVGKMDFADVISHEGLEQNPLLKSQDCMTGIQAFFKKEKPVFSGK